MPLWKDFLLLLICAFLTSSSWAQDQVTSQDDDGHLKIKSDIQLGILAGGELGNEKFTYKPGVIGQFSLNVQVSTVVHVGVGVALISLENETLLPVFTDFKAFFHDENSSFVGVNIGWSAAWSTYYRNVSEFEYEGGFYFSPYYSFQFPLTESTNLLIATGLVHSLGEIEFYTEFDEQYEEHFAMDFLTIRIGIRF